VEIAGHVRGSFFMPKKSIRGSMLDRRKHLAAETCLSHSVRIQQRILHLDAFRQAAALALYSPVWNEVFTEEVFREARRQGKSVVYPRVRGSDLDFVAVEALEELASGTFGVLEPLGDALVAPGALDMVLVPGVAFDLQGNRLGYGKGFYDRVLCGTRRPALVVGLCFEFQLVDRLPIEEHDACLDLLVTEEREYRFSTTVDDLFK
jgi:5-formyltetrahydrofolate cyclo-ligase